jgi:hypothetical protein
MAKQFSWSAPPLDVEDQKLIAAYEQVGKPLDFLPYTEEFDRLVHKLRLNETDENKHEVFRRLLNLRKTARLPRANDLIDSSRVGVPLSAEDEELVSAYERIRRPLDSLPYTEDFERLIDELGKPKTQAIRHALFQRLLRLRKRGRLPSVM